MTAGSGIDPVGPFQSCELVLVTRTIVYLCCPVYGSLEFVFKITGTFVNVLAIGQFFRWYKLTQFL